MLDRVDAKLAELTALRGRIVQAQDGVRGRACMFGTFRQATGK